MTWVDWVIVSIFVIFIFKGFRKGLVQQLFDLLGSVVALILAFNFYRQVGAIIGSRLHFSEPFSNTIGFILIIVVLGGLVSFMGKRWHASRRNEPIAVVDGGLGAVFGGAKAALLIMLILLIILALPWEFLHQPIEVSEFAGDLLRLAPFFYLLQERALPAEIPRMILSPDGLHWRKFDKESSLAPGSTVL